ncbi:MAG: DUF1287 domain-containing protein [Lachnospiraceae bacterium]|nr:DUF1287 domain-containing protein [Lachnospiraceae bacterium]
MKKEKNKKMVVILFFAVIVLVGAVGLYLFTDIRYFFFHTSSAPVHAKTNADFQIADIHSAVDADGDGIDDQTDILQGARAYIATNPRYKSKYYEGGYPNDGYGVCTDLVAYALRDAGYDLRALVDADIAANREMYAVDAPDDNIDYRRVRNLKVFFGHTAISLTTDIYDIAAWQGGDIVIFENHIGIVSDHRNDDGIAYVIHHNGTMQKAYEEDILAERDDIVGHYRMSAAE